MAEFKPSQTTMKSTLDLEERVAGLRENTSILVKTNSELTEVKISNDKTKEIQGLEEAHLPLLTEEDRFDVLDILSDQIKKYQTQDEEVKMSGDVQAISARENEKRLAEMAQKPLEAAELARRAERQAKVVLARGILTFYDSLMAEPSLIPDEIMQPILKVLGQGRIEVQKWRKDAYDLARIAASQGALALKAAGITNAEKSLAKHLEQDKQRREVHGIVLNSPEEMRNNWEAAYNNYKSHFESKFGKLDDDNSLRKAVGLREVVDENGVKKWEVTPGSLLDSTIQTEQMYLAADKSLKENLLAIKGGNVEVGESLVVAVEIRKASEAVLTQAWSAMVDAGCERAYPQLVAAAEKAGNANAVAELKSWHESKRPLVKMYKEIERALPGFLLGMTRYIMENEGKRSLGEGFMMALMSIMVGGAGSLSLELINKKMTNNIN